LIYYISVSFVGLAIAYRSVQNFSNEFALSRQACRSFLSLNLFIIILASYFFTSPIFYWLFIGILLITLKFFPNYLRFFLNARLQRQLVWFMDSVVLGIQGGKTFRMAFREAAENQTGWMKIQFVEIYNSILISKNLIDSKSSVISSFQREILDIANSHSRCLERSKSLRQHLKMIEDFRRRSGLVTQQIKIQALIVTALYLGLLLFVIIKFGYFSNRTFINFSFILFICGIAGIFLMGRQFKWKV
jgi:Flp pilus assembly protein TadB